jgi:hypothetical protein
MIYVGNRAFKTEHEAAQEVTRISGEDAGVWQISRALLWHKGLVNGVPVFAREREDPDNDGAAGKEATPGKPPRRARLLRIEEVYAGGIPPRWR